MDQEKASKGKQPTHTDILPWWLADDAEMWKYAVLNRPLLAQGCLDRQPRQIIAESELLSRVLGESAIANNAHVGWFSSNRTSLEYDRDLWHSKPSLHTQN